MLTCSSLHTNCAATGGNEHSAPFGIWRKGRFYRKDFLGSFPVCTRVPNLFVLALQHTRSLPGWRLWHIS